jgi:predicted DNA-binding transcriptional regulator AlpA
MDCFQPVPLNPCQCQAILVNFGEVKAGSTKMNIEFLTVANFLASYAISRSEFYRQANAGKIRLTKLGKATRIARADAENWAASLPVRTGGAV